MNHRETILNICKPGKLLKTRKFINHALLPVGCYCLVLKVRLQKIYLTELHWFSVTVLCKTHMVELVIDNCFLLNDHERVQENFNLVLEEA